MGIKLFDENDDSDNEDMYKIEIDKDFARRYEHNKKREDLHRLQELEKKHGPISGSADSQESETSSSDEEDDDDFNDIRASRKDLEFFDALIKVRDRDPIIKEKDISLFQSDDEDDDEGEEEEGKETTKQKKKKTYLKDVVARQVIEEGPDFNDDDDDDAHEGDYRKSYNEEQEELRQAFLKAASDGEDDGEFIKVKKKDDVDDDTTSTAIADELNKKQVEYFYGKNESLDEKNNFLMTFFNEELWRFDKDKKNKGLIDDNEIAELEMDEEEIEKQEDYEASYRHEEENLGDRVLGHSRVVDGSVRKKENARKKQRQSKEERMKIAEMERKEELKHLKNLKKEEMKEKLDKIKKNAGIGEEEDCPLDEDLDDEFDPEEHDRMMKVVFGDKYYDADDVNPEFGSDDDVEKPNFEKEDELLGLDDPESKVDGLFDDDDDEDEGKKRKRKKKVSLMKRAKEALMDEYYKLDYEDTIGDLKTRFKYAKTKPNRYGLKSGEILMVDDKELNQYVPLKKITPYREKEWKVPNNQRHQFKMKIREQLYGKKRKHREEQVVMVSSTEQEEEIAPNGGESSKQAKRRRRQGLKLPISRLAAYGKMTALSSKSKSKSKTKH